MKKAMLLFAILVSLVLSGCGEKLLDDKTANDYIDATKYFDSGRRAKLICFVNNVGKYSIDVEECEDTHSAYSISVSTATEIFDANGGELSLEDLAVGTKIEIIYDGNILETYPLRISKCYKIQIVD